MGQYDRIYQYSADQVNKFSIHPDSQTDSIKKELIEK